MADSPSPVPSVGSPHPDPGFRSPSRSPSPSRSRSASDSPPPLRARHHDNDSHPDSDGDVMPAKKFDLSVPICRDFSRGRCSRPPTDCRYAHPLPSVAIDGEQVTVCYDSLRDRCSRGYGCRYYHPPPHLRIKMQETIGIQAAQAPAGYQVDPVSQVRPSDVLYGAHSLPPPLPTSVPTSQRAISRPSIEVCRDFVRGRCARRAEECRFAHHTTAGGDGDYVIVCQDFLRGKCHRGMCRYFHPPSHLRSRVKDLPVGSVPDAVDHGGHNTSFEGAYGFTGASYEQQVAKRMRIDDVHQGTPGFIQYYGQVQGTSLYPVSALPPPPPPPLPPLQSHPIQQPPVLKDEDRLPVCRDFQRGICSRDTCRFVHPEPHTQVVDNFVTVCRDSLRGKCNRERCRFYHPPSKTGFKEENGGSGIDVSHSRSPENDETWDHSGESSPDQ